jgi:hypothetical protein
MRKIILTSVIGMALLTSCTKEESLMTECQKSYKEYQLEVSNGNFGRQQLDLLNQRYKAKYPKCAEQFNY